MEYNFGGRGREEGRKKWSTSIKFQGSEPSEERMKSERRKSHAAAAPTIHEMCKTPSSAIIGGDGMHAAYASEGEGVRERERQGRTRQGREERDDVKRGKFWPLAPPPPPNGMDLALTKDDQGEKEGE